MPSDAPGSFQRVTRPATVPPQAQAPARAPAPSQARPTRGGPPAIEVGHLRKAYGSGKLALQDATFQVGQGEVFGFLGPNGAGKTTTIRILTGMLRPTSGEAFLLGEPTGPAAASAKAHIGYVPDEPAFPLGLKALPLLVAYGRFHGLSRSDSLSRGKELLTTVGLEGQEQARIRSFSHGMTKRYALVQALLHDPPILIMDEPTSGLDPAGTAWFRDFLRHLRGQGKTIFLSSHLLHEVQQVCDRVGIIHQGRIRAVDTIGGLAGSVKQRAEVLVVAPGLSAEHEAAARAVPGVLAVRRDGDALHVDAETPDVAADINAALVRAGARVQRLEAARPSLEDIFLTVTKGDGPAAPPHQGGGAA